MGVLKRVSNGSKQPLNVLFTFILAIIGLLVLLQSLVSSAGRVTAVTYAQDPTQVITSTLTTQEKLDAYIQAHIIQGDVMPASVPEPSVTEETAPDVDVTAAVSYSVALLDDTVRVGMPGETITYTLILSNPGTLNDVYDITAVSIWPITVPINVFALNSGATANVIVNVLVPAGAANGDNDTAVIIATSRANSLVTDSAFLTTTAGLNKLFFPVIFTPLPIPSLSATRPNSANDWQMNWTISGSGGPLTGYELQQSQDATFATGVTTYSPAGSATSQLINTVQASANNVYYYRIRALKSGLTSGWSNVVKVVGAYYDEFTSNQTGWSGPSLKDALRRLTFIEKTDSWYENGQWLIVRVEDSWDWAIASPMMPAPEPPYVIEFRSKPANLGNLVSHGVVFGGDWTGASCPDWSTYLGVYAHQNCFNHFYNANLIWSSDTDLTLLWERIDTLVWCPNCGGSPLKRLGDIYAIGFHPNASDWNNYRIEVRESDIKFYLNGSLKYTYNDTRWIDEPYFGVFASADEYSNSTWRWEYYKITPLDS